MTEDGIDEALTVLQGLLGRIASLVLRACLEEARDGIAHLTGRDSGDRQEAA
jgi:hypothetical protein